MDTDEYDLYTAGTENQDAGPTLDDMTHLNITMDRTYLQSEEDIYTAHDEMPQPSAPLDIAKFKIKVDWTEPFPERWRARLQKALQSWLSRLEGKPSVLSLELMEDPSCAKVQMTPSRALEVLKQHTTIYLKFKDKDKDKDKEKEVATQICLDEAHSVTVPQKSLLEDKGAPSSKMNNSMPVTSTDADVEDIAASNRAPNETKTTKTVEMTPETPATFTLPLYQSWYMLHVYSKEVEQIKKQHGVSFCVEVSVSIKPTVNSSPDYVSKASEHFQKLAQECLDRFSYVAINNNDMDSDIMKQAINAVKQEDTKMMFTMSASNCLFFGPRKFIDIIKRETVERQLINKSSKMDVDNNVSPQSRSSLHMDTKDLPTHLEMDKVHWDLMKLSYKEQLSQLETKYGVSFHEEKLQNNLIIKVQARSAGVQHINLESHALKALTHLYQKLTSAVVSCELTNPAYKTAVAPMVEKLQQRRYCVVVTDAFSPWRLTGLPEHLGPAIVDIEKKLQKYVFNDKMKKLNGYSGDIPNARGIKRNQMPDYGPGAVWDEGVNFRSRSEADTGFNEDSKISCSGSKGAHAEEEMCAICMDSFIDKRKLKCGHEFCQECIRMSGSESLGFICPVCTKVFGKLEGNQPDGTMNVRRSRQSLPGYPDCGTIEIHYDIPNGIQTKMHPNPGKPFRGTYHYAYLPDNNEGNEVLRLLQRAFKQKLIFTVGKTTGLENAVTWNHIHHKTNMHGGPQNYGYPDPNYLKRVRDELKANGIE
ncbi:E3 ubiquitin-protein ligase DTX3L [Labeo rohita]|uniref:E3 ubiquitin-protein ligase DTX3L n=1 Tax=Labeo rohita TaxID=84645 RepID=UPI0021E21ED9|nr:E3 ubiquitin-protein ligase DTX3L [Labeo rohita]